MDIEKNVPLTNTRSRRGSKYDVIKDMDIGDSFLMEKSDSSSARGFQSYITQIANYLGVKVKTRTVEGGVRVWRVCDGCGSTGDGCPVCTL